MASTSSSSSVLPRKGCTYDVFLSFRGEDTRNNFVDHLFAALIQKGIHTFKDDEMLGGGQPISEELVKAIKESRFAVVIFSKNYASSSWCLEELSEIMECHHQMGLKVLPVFYHVHPSDVRKQTGDFTTAFQTHEDRFKGEMDKVNKWRDALSAAASLSGQHVMPDYGGEAEFISKIVQEILTNRSLGGGSMENHVIGIEPRIDALISLLEMEATEEVRFVGIWGMGGIGKTTVARALFNKIGYKFEGSSFVTDVRENSSGKKDICALQQKILKDILGASHGFGIHDPEGGGKVIQERCCRKKVLLVLDDVNDADQLDYLAAPRDQWFGPGSRIIITTRDEHLLSYANGKYKPALLSTDQAVELFCKHAFQKNSPPQGYEELSIRAINHAGRLPLALKVLGAFFHGRQANVWGNALERLAKTQDNTIFETLKLSFDNLSVSEKQIFMDIACFYKGHNVIDVTRKLDSFGFDPVIGISVLVEKCLIIVSSSNRVDMHDLIQEMGWKVVQESAPNSRLWQLEKIHDLIGKSKNPNIWLWHLEKMQDLIRNTEKTENRELEVIEGIVVAREDIEQGFGFGPRVFESMRKLRILEVKGYFTWFKPTFLPEELRWFGWRKYPFSSLPPVTHMSKLVGLEMVDGKIKHLWKGKKMMMLQNLKFINLRGCRSLKRFPDVSGAPNIERLDLSFCKNMVEVDESVGSLKKLVKLDMTRCYKLKRLPSMLHMESLETLILEGCWSLERIPEFSPCMVNLSHLNIRWCFEIKEVPSSIKYLSNLSHLKLNGCKSLEKIPNSILELKCLNTLRLSDYGKLQKLADDIQSRLVNMEELHIDSIHIIHANFTNFSSLRRLYLFSGDSDFPKNLHGLSSLEELHIEDNNKLIQLPESISHLSRLKHLQLHSCNRIKTIHGLPSGIQVLIAEGCPSLEKIEDLSEKYQCLSKIWISCCPKLRKDEENERYLNKMLEPSFLEKWVAVDGRLSINIPGSNIPSWFKAQQYGCQIALKLPPTWQTKIAGFAVCCVLTCQMSVFFRVVPGIKLRFENDGMFVPKSKAGDTNNETEEATNVNTWISYIPFSLFEQLHNKDNGNDFEGEDWFHMTEGNLVFEFSKWFDIDVKRCGASIQQTKPSVASFFFLGDVIKRCGAKVVYREDVASIQQTKPSVSSYYWSWKLTNEFDNYILCKDE